MSAVLRFSEHMRSQVVHPPRAPNVCVSGSASARKTQPHIQSVVGLSQGVSCVFPLHVETWAKRLALELWGSDSPRLFFKDEYWRQPLKWSREAERAGSRQRVFCASMADVFEGRWELDEWR